MVALLQWGSVIAGFSAAILWWLSVQSFYSQGKFDSWPPKGGVGDSDVSYVLDDNTVIVNYNRRVGLTNAWAAGLSGVAVLLQSLPQGLNLVGITLG